VEYFLNNDSRPEPLNSLVWSGQRLKRLPRMASVVVASCSSQDEEDERVRGDI